MHTHCLEEPPFPVGTNSKYHTLLEEARTTSAIVTEWPASKIAAPGSPWLTPKSDPEKNQKYKRVFLAKGYSSLSDSFSSSSSDLCWQESRKRTWEKIKRTSLKKGDWEMANKLDVIPVQYNRRGNPFWETLGFNEIKELSKAAREHGRSYFSNHIYATFFAHTLTPHDMYYFSSRHYCFCTFSGLSKGGPSAQVNSGNLSTTQGVMGRSHEHATWHYRMLLYTMRHMELRLPTEQPIHLWAVASPVPWCRDPVRT